MKTKHRKLTKNRTLKKRSLKPKIKHLKKGYKLFASKKGYGDKILEHTKEEETKYQDTCLFGNMSWFGDYEQAKSYKQKDQNIYKWTIKKQTNLLITDESNEDFIKKLFENATLKLETTINLSKEQELSAKKYLKKENINCSYLDLTQNERAYFEFSFAYGYITAEEQYEFMKLVKFLIQKKYLDIKNREDQSILKKINQKINYYYYLQKINSRELSLSFTSNDLNKIKYNRLSIYLFDKYSLNNLCKITPKNYKLDGVFQPDNKSIWFPDLKIYKMNIQEYVLYNPHHNLTYNEIVE